MTPFFYLPLAIFNLGAPELIVLLLIVLLLFGGAKLPKLARGLGQSIKEFKKAQESDSNEKDDDGTPAKPDKKSPSDT